MTNKDIEFTNLRKQLKEDKRLGLYTGALNITKPQMRKEVNRIRKHTETLTSDQIDLFRYSVDNFIHNNRVSKREKSKQQIKFIRYLKETYNKIVKQTGITGSEDTKEFFKKAQPGNSVSRTQDLIHTLRRRLLPIISEYNTLRTSVDVDDYSMKDVKEQLKQLRKEGKVNVDLRQSNQKLRKILSKHIIENTPKEVSFDAIEVHTYPEYRSDKNKFKGLLSSVTIETDPPMKSIKQYFAKIQEELLGILKEQSDKSSFKMFYVLTANMYRENDPLMSGQSIKFFSSDQKNAEPVPSNSSEDYLEEVMNELADHIDILVTSFQTNGSDWKVRQIDDLTVNFATWKPMKGGSYLELPPALKNKNYSLTNIKNNDDYCFLYNNIRRFHKPTHHPDRVSHYKKKVDTFAFNTRDFKFPMSKDQIPKWDELNNTRTFVFKPQIKNNKLVDLEPVYIDRKNIDCPNEVCHLLIEDENTGKYHFVYINNISALAPHTNKSVNKQHLCANCMNWFRSEEKLEEHKKTSQCYRNDCCKVKMPNEGSTLSFTEFQKMNRLPFMVVFDIESNLVKCPKSKVDRFVNQHVPNSLCATFYSDFGDKETKVFYGSECVIQFLDWLTSKEDYIKDKMIQNEDMVMTSEDEKNFKQAKHCYLCQQPFPTKYNTDISPAIFIIFIIFI